MSPRWQTRRSQPSPLHKNNDKVNYHRWGEFWENDGLQFGGCSEPEECRDWRWLHKWDRKHSAYVALSIAQASKVSQGIPLAMNSPNWGRRTAREFSSYSYCCRGLLCSFLMQTPAARASSWQRCCIPWNQSRQMLPLPPTSWSCHSPLPAPVPPLMCKPEHIAPST